MKLFLVFDILRRKNKVDLTELNKLLKKPIKVLTLYYGLRNERDNRDLKDKYKLIIRRHDNQVWIEKK